MQTTSRDALLGTVVCALLTAPALAQDALLPSRLPQYEEQVFPPALALWLPLQSPARLSI